MSRNKIDYGIDLGTTNSAIVRMEKGKPKIIKSDTLKDTMPSCVHYNKRGDCLVGDKAIAVLKNDRMRAMKGFKKYETNTFIEFKRTMGKDTKYQCPNLNRDLTSEELSAEVLKRLKSSVLDENISSVVITVPAKFTVPQNEATIRAANMAGFKQVVLLQEPIAAVIAYSLESGKKDGYWLVFDFSESVFDVALIKAEEGVMRVIDTDGDNFLGGKNLDEAIVDQIILPYLQETYCIDSILNNPDKREILRKGVKRYAEDAKIEMSFKESTTILSNLGDIPFEDEFGEKIEIDIPLIQKDIERVFAPIFQKAIDITKELLRRNNLDKDKLNSLILVGEPTHSPILRRMLKEQITENVGATVDPMTVVAQGAALFASTVDIEITDDGKTIQGTSTDSDKIVLELRYPPFTVEPTSEMVSIKVLKDKSMNIPDEIFVELKRSDGSWSVIKQVNDKKATIFDVELIPEKANFFEIYVWDAEANQLNCEQEGFTLVSVDPLPPATLPYHIGTAKYFEDKDKELFYPVKGLEKNKEIPATGVANGLKTRSIIEKGNANHKFRIPIYQGDYGVEGTELSLNCLIYEVIITGKNLPATLPEGSIVDITIKVDESQRMYFIAYFPCLNYSEEMEIEIQQEKVPSINDVLNEISNAEQLIAKIRACDEFITVKEDRMAAEASKKFSELKDELENNKNFPDDGRLKIQHDIRELRYIMWNIEYRKARRDMEAAYSILETQIIKAKKRWNELEESFENIRQQVEQIDTVETNALTINNLEERIKELINNIWTN